MNLPIRRRKINIIAVVLHEEYGSAERPTKARTVVPWAGFEPTTYALGKRCSIQLSYQGKLATVCRPDATHFEEEDYCENSPERIVSILNDPVTGRNDGIASVNSCGFAGMQMTCFQAPD